MNTSLPPILEAYAVRLTAYGKDYVRQAASAMVTRIVEIDTETVVISAIAGEHETFAELTLYDPIPEGRRAEIARHLSELTRPDKGPTWSLDLATGQLVMRTMPLERQRRIRKGSVTVEELINDVGFGISLVSGQAQTLRDVAAGQLGVREALAQAQADILETLGLEETPPKT